jgi:hypothetical protein
MTGLPVGRHFFRADDGYEPARRATGYLLQGGYGWNSRVLGPACESVVSWMGRA